MLIKMKEKSIIIKTNLLTYLININSILMAISRTIVLFNTDAICRVFVTSETIIFNFVE